MLNTVRLFDSSTILRSGVENTPLGLSSPHPSLGMSGRCSTRDVIKLSSSEIKLYSSTCLDSTPIDSGVEVSDIVSDQDMRDDNENSQSGDDYSPVLTAKLRGAHKLDTRDDNAFNGGRVNSEPGSPDFYSQQEKSMLNDNDVPLYQASSLQKRAVAIKKKSKANKLRDFLFRSRSMSTASSAVFSLESESSRSTIHKDVEQYVNKENVETWNSNVRKGIPIDSVSVDDPAGPNDGKSSNICGTSEHIDIFANNVSDNSHANKIHEPLLTSPRMSTPFSRSERAAVNDSQFMARLLSARSASSEDEELDSQFLFNAVNEVYAAREKPKNEDIKFESNVISTNHMDDIVVSIHQETDTSDSKDVFLVSNLVDLKNNNKKFRDTNVTDASLMLQDDSTNVDLSIVVDPSDFDTYTVTTSSTKNESEESNDVTTECILPAIENSNYEMDVETLKQKLAICEIEASFVPDMEWMLEEYDKLVCKLKAENKEMREQTEQVKKNVTVRKDHSKQALTSSRRAAMVMAGSHEQDTLIDKDFSLALNDMKEKELATFDSLAMEGLSKEKSRDAKMNEILVSLSEMIDGLDETIDSSAVPVDVSEAQEKVFRAWDTYNEAAMVVQTIKGIAVDLVKAIKNRQLEGQAKIESLEEQLAASKKRELLLEEKEKESQQTIAGLRAELDIAYQCADVIDCKEPTVCETVQDLKNKLSVSRQREVRAKVLERQSRKKLSALDQELSMSKERYSTTKELLNENAKLLEAARSFVTLQLLFLQNRHDALPMPLEEAVKAYGATNCVGTCEMMNTTHFSTDKNALFGEEKIAELECRFSSLKVDDNKGE